MRIQILYTPSFSKVGRPCKIFQHFRPAVNRQPGYRREAVEQSIVLNTNYEKIL